MSEEESVENFGEVMKAKESKWIYVHESKSFDIEAESIEEAEKIVKQLILSGEWRNEKYGEFFVEYEEYDE